MIGREQRMSGVEGVSWLIRRLRPRPLFDGRFDHPERVKRATAWIAVDQQLFSPYVVGLGCKIESAKYHCADHHIWRHFRPRTRNRYVQAHSGRLLFEGDRNAIAEGQIHEFSRRALMSVFDVPGIRRVPRGGPAFELFPGQRMRTRARHCRLERSAFSLADDYRHRLRTMELTSVLSTSCGGKLLAEPTVPRTAGRLGGADSLSVRRFVPKHV